MTKYLNSSYSVLGSSFNLNKRTNIPNVTTIPNLNVLSIGFHDGGRK